jgi:hypothetical protein
MKNTCEVCGRQTSRKTLCEAHYYRLRRTGSVGDAAIQTGDQGCSVDGCDRKHRAHDLCSLHWARKRRNGTTELLPAVGPRAPRWAGDEVGYGGAHQRVRRERGPASDHTCPCGEPAGQWAIDHARAPLSEDGMPYSPNPQDYTAMCVPCHKRMDLGLVE